MRLLKTSLLMAVFAALPAVAPAQTWTPPPAEPAPPAQTDPERAPEGSADDGFDLIERGAGLLLNQLLRQAESHLDDMGRSFGEAMDTLGPLVGDLAAQVDDMRNYEKPERLANGDILIRRKAEAPPPPPPGEVLRRFTIPRPTPDAKPEATPGPDITSPQPQIEL